MDKHFSEGALYAAGFLSIAQFINMKQLTTNWHNWPLHVATQHTPLLSCRRSHVYYVQERGGWRDCCHSSMWSRLQNQHPYLQSSTPVHMYIYTFLYIYVYICMFFCVLKIHIYLLHYIKCVTCTIHVVQMAGLDDVCAFGGMWKISKVWGLWEDIANMLTFQVFGYAISVMHNASVWTQLMGWAYSLWPSPEWRAAVDTEWHQPHIFPVLAHTHPSKCLDFRSFHWGLVFLCISGRTCMYRTA